jgi:hypothetical protein
VDEVLDLFWRDTHCFQAVNDGRYRRIPLTRNFRGTHLGRTKSDTDHIGEGATDIYTN